MSFVWSAIRPPWAAGRRRTHAEAAAAGPGADRTGAGEATPVPVADEPTAVPAADGATDGLGGEATHADDATAGPDADGIPDGEGRRTLAMALAPWAVVLCYLVGGVALTWRLWADPAGRAQIVPGSGIRPDVDLFAWFLRYSADAVSHGHLPALVTTALNAPTGVNLMWNTSLLLPAVLLTPVTLLAGPQVSLTIVLTLAFAGSAAALYLVLRRWGASISAAALGGAVYGFSPAVRIAAPGHYHLILLILPPLIIDALLRILTGRGRAWLGGVWLGLLVAAQVYISEEILAQTALAAVIIVLVLAASRPRKVPERLAGAAVGAGCALVVALAATGYALWVQFHGPLTEKGSPWKVIHFRNPPADFVSPPGGLLFSGTFGNHPAVNRVAVGEYVAYLGWPLLVVLVIAAVVFWRDVRVRIASVTCLLLEVFSLGAVPIPVGAHGHFPAALLPWHYLQHLPVINEMLADRFSILGDGAAGAVLAFSLDRARAAVHHDWRRWAAAAVAVLAVLPVVPLPFPAGPLSPVPAGWTTVIARLRLAPGAAVMVVPDHPPQMMRWQADTGQPGSLVGGYCIAPDPAGQAKACRAGKSVLSTFLTKLWDGDKGLPWPSPAQVSASLAKMRPAAILVAASSGSRLERVSVRLFGPPTVQDGGVLGWRR